MLYNSLAPSEQSLARPYVHELHSVLNDRLQQVCGWFIRPVFRRDQYSLRMLAFSIFSIVRELDVRYAFKEEVTVDENIVLSRGSFDLFGDILFVLVGNGAKHGKVDGLITISGEQHGSNKIVHMRVSSSVDSEIRYREAIARIESALFVGDGFDIDRAAVEEGFSGLRKVVGILKRVRFARRCL
jgi:hypothetical protein